MIEVVSIRFNNRGKSYSFAPNGLEIGTGEKVIVETAKGLEIADCSRGNHWVEETAVVQPLRPVARIATADDLRIAELNKKREKEAFQICQEKIAEHGLEMKLVDVECNFEGSKTMFFFTADGRVDFRELVKDLASIFRNRIELRQIGVRDEAKMIGGIGICGRPFCCSQFLEDFQPVSTKMAKIQSLSLNPTKISGSCGRLMCCLRYEQDAYEDLIKKVPKQGAFVETIDGYGTAAQVNLLRQTVKVKLDQDKDDTLHLYKSNELAAVPGGRPRDGEEPPHVLHYVPEEPEIPEGFEGGRVESGGVPGMKLTRAGVREKAAFLYIHGGGFTLGSGMTAGPLLRHVLEKTGLEGWSVDYSLAPYRKFPTQINQTVDFYRGMLETGIEQLCQSFLALMGVGLSLAALAAVDILIQIDLFV